MSGRRKDLIDIQELLRQLRTGDSNRHIARQMRIDRRTVKRYRQWAQAHDLLTGPPPLLEELQALAEKTLSSSSPPQNISSVEPYRELVTQLVKENVEIAAIKCRLEERGFDGSYSAVYRFVRTLQPRTPEAVVRVERQPGEEAQVDFCYAGRMLDPERDKLRRTWAFVMVLSWSRHQYVEFDKAYYSAPHRLITQDVCVCGGLQQMRIFTLDYKLIATHERAQKPGERKTHLDHLPPHKVPGLLLDRDTCLAAATDVGEATAQVGGTLLADPVLDRLPTVGQLLKLRGKFDDQRLEAACRRALYFDDPAYKDRQAHPVRRPGRASHPAPGNCAPGDRIRARAGGFAGHIPGRCANPPL